LKNYCTTKAGICETIPGEFIPAGRRPFCRALRCAARKDIMALPGVNHEAGIDQRP